MLKVYLASRFSRGPELNQYRLQLNNAGIETTSRWLNGGHLWEGTDDDQLPQAVGAQFAQEDLDDLLAADVLVAFTEPPRSGPSRGGRHVEFGVALAAGLQIVIVGHRENVFYCLPSLILTSDWPSAFDLLQREHSAPGALGRVQDVIGAWS
jgi:nucleoside 2-deoxyribosyltransferase